MWGLTSSGAITVNVIDAANNTVAATAPFTLPMNKWTHITQTFSPTNGNRLYMNGVLVSSVTAATGRPVGPYTFIGASPVGTTSCPSGAITPGQFCGMVDEYRVFGVELTPADVCYLVHV